MSNFVKNLKKGQDLSFEESKALFNELMEGKHNENSVIEILDSLLKKGETKDELAGGIFVLREKAAKVNTDQNTIDTCGTGGDGQNSLNISNKLYTPTILLFIKLSGLSIDLSTCVSAARLKIQLGLYLFRIFKIFYINSIV